jgi:hypothetical protein
MVDMSFNVAFDIFITAIIYLLLLKDVLAMRGTFLSILAWRIWLTIGMVVRHGLFPTHHD